MVRVENFKEKDYVFYKPIDRYPHVQWWVHKDDLDVWKQIDSVKNESNT